MGTHRVICSFPTWTGGASTVQNPNYRRSKCHSRPEALLIFQYMYAYVYKYMHMPISTTIGTDLKWSI